MVGVSFPHSAHPERDTRQGRELSEMSGRLPQAIFYVVLGISALAVVAAGALVLLQEPQFQALVPTRLH
jgi:hypothetical protein